MTLQERFSQIRVLCIGDVMIDRFITGTVHRISPESPVPVLSVQGSQTVAGGAGNVARNVASLGGACTLVSVVGADGAGAELARVLREIPRLSPVLVEAPGRVTTEKVRYVAQGQHMLRTDTEQSHPIGAAQVDDLLTCIAAEIARHDVLVLSDYAKGVLTDQVVAGAIEIARKHGVPCVVDPKSARMERYAGATVITPNTREVHMATGLDAAGADDVAVEAGRALLVRMPATEAVLVTRADKGMTLVTARNEVQHVKATAREVFDVVGAGDTVVATLALALGSGMPLAESARLANAAAGIVVGKRGTATLTPSELMQAVADPVLGGLDGLREKVMPWPEAQRLARMWQEEGLRVGFTNGCFDILHVGHLSLLSFARSRCDRLIVGLNADSSVRRLKGNARPINREVDRALVLAALACVDAVVLFEEDTPLELIRTLMPNLLVKGADYAVDAIVGADVVHASGGEVITCPMVDGRSTTRVVQHLAQGDGVAP